MDPEELQKAIDVEFNNGECVVAYLDILGFKDLVNKYLNPQNTNDKYILKIIKSAMEDAKKPLNDFKMSDPEFKGIDLIKIKQFSDCISFSIPDFYGHYNEAVMVSMFLTVLNGYNIHFIRKNLYLRGGISPGFHYEDENIIFSDGLIKSYYLESKKAIYPRIIIDDELINRIKRLWKHDKTHLSNFGIQKKIIVDWEGTTFINPFNPTQSMGKMFSEGIVENLSSNKDENTLKSNLEGIDKNFHLQVMKNLNNKIAEYKWKGDNHILRKYLWLKELLNWNMEPKSSKIKFEYLLKSE